MINYILYVDDDRDDAEIFYEVVTTIYPAIKVTTVDNGRDALDILSKHCPDMVFLDYKMPQMNGIEVLEAIKKTTCNKTIIVMYSDSRDGNYIEQCQKAGAFACWQKMTPDNLQSSLKKLHSED